MDYMHCFPCTTGMDPDECLTCPTYIDAQCKPGCERCNTCPPHKKNDCEDGQREEAADYAEYRDHFNEDGTKID